MATDEDVPPLEDMTELVEQVKRISHRSKENEGSKIQSTKTASSVAPPVKDPAEVEKRKQEKAANQTQKKAAAAAAGFGGMKKGFLFGGPSVPKSKSAAKPVAKPAASKAADDIPLLKPKQSKEEERRIPEVQEAMMSNFMEKNKDTWMTEDLLNKVQKNESVMKHLADPKFVAALSEFQTNPKAAAEKYKDNPEMDRFLRDFSGIMGDHLSGLGEQTPPPAVQDEDERRMQQILADPEIQEIFQDPRVQKLFGALRTDPDSVQRFIREADPVLQQRLHKLVAVGLLQIE